MVWGGTHPDEQFALAVADSLELNPILHVTSGIANPLARAQGRRFVEQNMQGSYPGNPNSAIYEERRAAEILEINKSYDVVIDLHENQYQGVDYATVDTTAVHDSRLKMTPESLGLLAHLGIKHIVATPYPTMLTYTPNCFGVDVQHESELHDVNRWRSTLENFTRNTFAEAAPHEFTWWQFVDGMTIAQKQQLRLPDTMEPFELLPSRASRLLGTPRGQNLHMLVWGANVSGYCGEIATPLETPSFE